MGGIKVIEIKQYSFYRTPSGKYLFVQSARRERGIIKAVTIGDTADYDNWLQLTPVSIDDVISLLNYPVFAKSNGNE